MKKQHIFAIRLAFSLNFDLFLEVHMVQWQCINCELVKNYLAIEAL